MIVLDTNVLSALMRAEPDEIVVTWLDAQMAQSVWITSITLFEARFGLASLPEGARRRQLTGLFDDLPGMVINPWAGQDSAETAS